MSHTTLFCLNYYTMHQNSSQNFLPFIVTLINDSMTSGHLEAALETASVISILKKSIQLFQTSPTTDKYHFYICILSKIPEHTIYNKLSYTSPGITSKIQISLVHIQHISQKLPMWLLLRRVMLIDQPNCHQSSFSWTFQQLSCQSS